MRISAPEPWPLGSDIASTRSFDALLETTARFDPDHVFLRTPDGDEISYGRFVERRAGVAGALRSRLGRGDRVLLAIPTSVRQFELLFAIWHLGAVAVMANPAGTGPETTAILRRTGAVLGIVDAELDGRLREAGTAVELLVDGTEPFLALFESSAPSPPLDPPLAAEEPATVLFTSGSTAEPKSVTYRHGNHVFAGEAFRRNLSFSPADVLMHHFPLFHMNGLGQVAAVVAAGATVLLLPRFRSGLFDEMLDEFRPTVTFLNSTHIKMIRERATGDRSRSSLRLVALALQISDEDYRWFEDRYGRVLRNAFGMTETVAGCIMTPWTGPKPQSIGVPTPGYRVRVIGEDGADCPPGEVGELLLWCFSPYGLIMSYDDDPESTREAFVDGWYHTGDLVHRDAEGYLYWVGRSKEIIKRAGESISPAEVEKAIEEFPGVVEAVVVGRPDYLREEVPIAVVVGEDSVTANAIIDYCRTRLAEFKLPAEIVFVDELPKTPVGKIIRRQVRDSVLVREERPHGAQ